MRALVLALALILLVGMAGAVVTIGKPTYNFGPQAGFKNAGTIQGSDLYATDDLLVTDDAQVGGDFTALGTGVFGGGYIANGEIDEDLEIAPGHHILGATGAGHLDLGRWTGTAIMPTGPTYLNATRIADEMPLYAGGPVSLDKVWINGTTTAYGPIYSASRGTFARVSVNDSTTTRILKVNSTSAFSLATPITGNTTFTAATLTTFIPCDPTSACVIVNLPLANTVPAGTPVTVYTTTAPSTGHYIGITVQAGILGYSGAPGLRSADASCSMTVVSDGTKWWPTMRFGTWGHAP